MIFDANEHSFDKVRFCEFLNTLRDLLSSIDKSTKIANDIVDYMYNEDRELSIYHIGDK